MTTNNTEETIIIMRAVTCPAGFPAKVAGFAAEVRTLAPAIRSLAERIGTELLGVVDSVPTDDTASEAFGEATGWDNLWHMLMDLAGDLESAAGGNPSFSEPIWAAKRWRAQRQAKLVDPATPAGERERLQFAVDNMARLGIDEEATDLKLAAERDARFAGKPTTT